MAVFSLLIRKQHLVSWLDSRQGVHPNVLKRGFLGDRLTEVGTLTRGVRHTNTGSSVFLVGAPGIEPGRHCLLIYSQLSSPRYSIHPYVEQLLAEGVGFEPTDPEIDGLASRWFQPLTHPSCINL